MDPAVAPLTSIDIPIESKKEICVLLVHSYEYTSSVSTISPISPVPAARYQLGINCSLQEIICGATVNSLSALLSWSSILSPIRLENKRDWLGWATLNLQ